MATRTSCLISSNGNPFQIEATDDGLGLGMKTDRGRLKSFKGWSLKMADKS